MPPATMTRSAPSAASTGQAVPNGPRTPSTSPGRTAQSARVTWPTARTVCTSGPGSVGSPLIEIGTSPTPIDESIVNCPGRYASRSPDAGSSVSVHVSAVSRRRRTTR